jgi:hypothetical protein
MGRLERLRSYANPMKGPAGAGRDQENLDYWADRANGNSNIAPRASDGPMKLPNTGKRTDLRDTNTAPKVSRNADARMQAKADTNMVGDSPYMRGIRRNA